MKKIVFLILISFSVFGQLSFGQDYCDDKFKFEKGGLFKNITVIKKSGFEMSQIQMVKFASDVPQMRPYFKPLMTLYLSQTVVSATGAILTSWPLIQIESGKKPNMQLTYAGIATIVVGAILKKVFMNKAEKAARFYNNDFQELSARTKFQLKPLATQQGVGLALTF